MGPEETSMDHARMVTVEVPEEVRLALHESVEEFIDEIRMAAAAKLFELGKLSTGKAAQLAGVPSLIFLQRLGRYKVSVLSFRSDEDLEEEVQVALRATLPSHQS